MPRKISQLPAKPMKPAKTPKAPTIKGIAGMALPPGTGAMMPNPLMPPKRGPKKGGM